MPKRKKARNASSPRAKTETLHQTTAPIACVELISEIGRLLPKMLGAVNELQVALSQEEDKTGDAHHVPPARGGIIKPPPGRWYHDVPPPEGSIYSGNGPLTATRKKLATVMTMAENTLVKRSKDGKYYVTQNAFGKGFDIWFRTNNEYEMYKKRL